MRLPRSFPAMRPLSIRKIEPEIRPELFGKGDGLEYVKRPR
jgi:hypothetical protein